MASTFGEQLTQFALALDAIDERNFKKIRELINKYTTKTLNITSTRLLVASEVHQVVDEVDSMVVGLVPYGLAQEGEIQVTPVKNANGEYTSQASFTFGMEKELWVVSADPEQSLLRETITYLDQWSGQSGLPRYRAVTDEGIRTSILVPLRFANKRVFGVASFETVERVDLTLAAKDELKNLAMALSITYRLLRDSDSRAKRTAEGLVALDEVLSQPLVKLTRPKIFVASSERANKDVIDAIRQVIEEYKTTFDEVYWKDMNKPGSIDQQLLTELAYCRYGVFYMSEPAKGRKGNFRDNINVVFEAGMLHGRSDVGSPIPASWIPVREEGSPPPFDFAQQRTIIVPRNDKNELEAESFKDKLRECLAGFIADG